MATISAIQKPRQQLVTYREQADGLVDKQLESIARAHVVAPASKEAHNLLLDRMVTLAKSPQGRSMGNRLLLIVGALKASAAKNGFQARDGRFVQ